jgi:3-dehydroquinate dehydratase type I
LLKLLLEKTSDEEMIILGMGDNGQITRILSLLLGGYLTFASTKYGGSAPGQIDIEQLKNIYNLLSNC